MKNNAKHLLVNKTDIIFNKAKLLEALNKAGDSNVVVVTTSHFNVDNELHVAHEVAPMLLDKKTGEMTPSKTISRAAQPSSFLVSEDGITGRQLGPCPYPPGCDTVAKVARAENILSSLGIS